MSALLLFFKTWQAWAMGALLVGAAAVYVEKTAHIALLEHKVAGLEKEIKDAKDLGEKTKTQNKAIETQRIADQKEATNEATRMSTRASDDHSSAVAALAGLLRDAASGRPAASDPPVAAVGAPAEGAGLRPNLLGSVGDEAIRYAEIADVARIGRERCEAKYDALSHE